MDEVPFNPDPARARHLFDRRPTPQHELAGLRMGRESGYIVETSLGYFINPLLSVLLGVGFLERAFAACAMVPDWPGSFWRDLPDQRPMAPCPGLRFLWHLLLGSMGW